MRSPMVGKWPSGTRALRMTSTRMVVPGARRAIQVARVTPLSIRSALSDPVLPAGNKGALLEELLEGKVAGATLILLRRAVAPPGDPVARIQELADRAASRRGRVMVAARTAVELDAERRGRLARALSGVTGRDVDLEVTVDPRVVGGVMARVGDEIIDGTIRRRLELALEQIAG